MAEPRTLVCSECLMASCWHMEFPCDDHKKAGLLRATESQLRRLGLEHPDYFVSRMGHDNPREPILTDEMINARDEA